MTTAVLTLAALYAFWTLYVLCMGFYRVWLHRRLRGMSRRSINNMGAIQCHN